MAAVPELKPLSKGEYIRMALATNLRVALRDRQDEVTRGGSRDVRDTAANALYQTSVGYGEIEPQFERAVAAVAAGEPFGVIGQRFTEWVTAASAHYVELTAERVEDPDWGRRVDFEAREQ